MSAVKGKLNIVGIGPGSHDHLTPAALKAIQEASHVIGYTTYINLTRNFLEGKQITKTGMTEEIARAQAAVETARSGNIVTVISSGDAGVYGMAGLVFEVLRKIGWKRGDSPEICLIPGITAANSCASLVGAPLVHDSCVISLSDLLTPWPVIENRLECAAKSDFVITLYNPASGRRQRQIVEAARIIKKHRPGETPVALVKSAYRKQQKIIHSDLNGFLDFEIGMNTTVIIGNTNTFVYEGYMITPRGYTHKYSLENGAVKEGQKPGFSLRYERANAEANAPSVQSALDALEILAKQAVTARERNPAMAAAALPQTNTTPGLAAVVEASGDARENETGEPGFLGRMLGALVFKSESNYFLIGNTKEPGNFEEFGFKNFNPGNDSCVLLSPADPHKSQILRFDIAVAFHGEPGAREIYKRLAVYRNGSISERLLSFVKESSATLVWKGKEYADARWLAQTPESAWSMVRENLLKCR